MDLFLFLRNGLIQSLSMGNLNFLYLRSLFLANHYNFKTWRKPINSLTFLFLPTSKISFDESSSIIENLAIQGLWYIPNAHIPQASYDTRGRKNVKSQHDKVKERRKRKRREKKCFCLPKREKNFLVFLLEKMMSWK